MAAGGQLRERWAESGNQRFLCISQPFRNDSGPALCTYLLEVPERQLDCLPQTYHLSLRQPHVKSSTYLQVLVNGQLPFMVGLHWKDTSRAPCGEEKGSASFYSWPTFHSTLL